MWGECGANRYISNIHSYQAIQPPLYLPSKVSPTPPAIHIYTLLTLPSYRPYPAVSLCLPCQPTSTSTPPTPPTPVPFPSLWLSNKPPLYSSSSFLPIPFPHLPSHDYWASQKQAAAGGKCRLCLLLLLLLLLRSGESSVSLGDVAVVDVVAESERGESERVKVVVSVRLSRRPRESALGRCSVRISIWW